MKYGSSVKVGVFRIVVERKIRVHIFVGMGLGAWLVLRVFQSHFHALPYIYFARVTRRKVTTEHAHVKRTLQENRLECGLECGVRCEM